MESPKDNKPFGFLGMFKTSKTFYPNLNILHQQWTHSDNQVKRKWYVSTYTFKQRESFIDLWMMDMRRMGCEIEFFKWFEMSGRIENCAPSLQVIINKWYTASNKVVESITSPLEGINIPNAGTVIKDSPFKEKSDKIGGLLTCADIDRVVEQNNYSNQILYVISRQIEDTKPTISGRPTPDSTSYSHNIETYPGFKIPEFFKEKFPKLSDTFELTRNTIEKFNEQLRNFNTSIKDDKAPKKVSTLQKEPVWTLQEKSTERFISKLPPLFADKVRTKIQDRNNDNIHYGNLTYGDLVITINVVALELCTDIKLKQHLKKEQSSSRKELEIFCRDFGFISPPDKIKKDKKEKSHREKSRTGDDSTRSKKKHRSKRPRDTKLDVCWTCRKTGHKASECRSGTK
ncbi:hypothetical protein KY289_001281 [Solanum tuberosum]|nr:hypothetical protein KY289_001281 [Solanum tuberosum]